MVERAQRRRFDDAEIATWIHDARRLAELDHPNVTRVRDVILRADEVEIVSDFVDGVRWTEFAPRTDAESSGASPPLETALRVFVDALSGLSALHNLRDAKRQPLKLVHGGLTPDCLIVGTDGITRVIGAARLRSASARLPGSGSAYLAPEVLLEDDTADARADVYSIGVMLWEALSGRAFLPHLQPSAIVTHLLSGRLPAVTTPSASPWAAALAAVVTRALSADPAKRFASASTLAAEIRRVAGPRLPTAVRVGSLVHEAFGETIRARRQGLERGETRSSVAPSSLPAPQKPPEEFDIDIDEETTEASSTAPTLPPPGAEPQPLALAAPVPVAPPTAPRDIESATTVTPIAIATPIARAEPEYAPPARRRPKAWLFGVVVGSAVLALAAVGLLGTRRHDPPPLLLRPAAPVTLAQPPPANRPPEPAEPAVNIAQPPAVAHPAEPAEPAETVSPPAASSAATNPTPYVPSARTGGRAPSRSSSNVPYAPEKPRPAASTRHAYDPQGI